MAVALLLILAPSISAAAPVHLISGATNYTATSAHAPTVSNLAPIPGSRVRTFYPQFSATIDTHGGSEVERRSLRLFVDGMEVTASAAITQNTVTYLPHSRVSSGWHDVFLEGADTAGRKFSDAWVFELLPPDTGIEPATGGFGFFPVGSPDFGGFMHFVLIAPTDGFADLQLCGIPQLAFVHVRLSPVFFLTVPVTFENGFSPFFGCNVGAFFSPFNGFNQFGTVFLPLPLEIAGPNVQPNIVLPPSGEARQLQPVYRRTEFPLNTAPALPQTTITSPRSLMPIYRMAPQNFLPVPNAMAPPFPGPGTSTVPLPPMPVAGSRPVLPVTRGLPAPHVPIRVPAPPPPVPIPH